ncbi:MAG: ABC transporter permease [Chthoniobacterales bacterium]
MITTAPEPIEAAPATPGGRVWRRFRANKIGMVAMAMVIVLAVVAITFFILDRLGIPFPMDPDATNLERKLLPPNAVNWLGTDTLGRDVLSRLLNGAYISLTDGVVAVFVSLFIGVVVGAVAGYFGKWVDNLIMRAVDALMCFPTFFLILTAVALLGPRSWGARSGRQGLRAKSEFSSDSAEEMAITMITSMTRHSCCGGTSASNSAERRNKRAAGRRRWP